MTTPRPLPLHSPPALRKPLDQRQPRASLDGLEVRESSFGEWLAAGGERRQLPREPDLSNPAL